jgi:VanZ family protein
VHGVLFLSLGFLIAVRIAAADRITAIFAKLTLALVLLVLLGGLAESAQMGIASRSASYGDWTADTIGAAFGLWLGSIIARSLMLLVVHDEATVAQRSTSE